MAAGRTCVATTYIYPRCRKAPQFAQRKKRYQWQEGQKNRDTNGYLVARAIH